MAAQLPPEVSTFKVVGRLVRSVIDSNDPGQEPDMVPVSGARVTFTPTLNPPIFKIPTTSPPVTVYQETIVATTDTNGFLKAPTDNTLGVILPWGFSEGITPNGWNWSVKIAGVGNFPERSFVISGSADGVVDLATVIPVPASPGSEIYAWEQIVDQVTRARDEAVAAASQAQIAKALSVVYSPDGTRPPTNGAVMWIGHATQPPNAIINDIWLQPDSGV